MKKLKELTLIEWLVILGIVATIGAAIASAFVHPSQVQFGPDGKAIYIVTINGHEYLKTGDLLTHSASCPACTQMEAK